MKRHSFTAALTAFAMCLTSFLILPAYALSKGDVDNDKKITASDARSILRVSVGLETVDEETKTAADVDNDNKITASDARLVLRVSVGLEKLPDSHKHTYRYEQITDENGNVDGNKCLRICDECGEKTETEHVFGDFIEVTPPTCVESGSGYKECINCGYQAFDFIPQGRHSFTIKLDEKKKTCTEEGFIKWKCDICGDEWTEKLPASHNPGPAVTCTSDQVCLDCGEVLAPALGHKIDSLNIGVRTGIKCSRCGEEAVPSFNDIVNRLKADKEDINTYSGYYKTVGNFKQPVYSDNAVGLLFKTFFDKEFKGQVGTNTSYSAFTKDRLLTNDSFPISGENFVSNLDEGDVKSITMERTDNIDFMNQVDSVITDKDGNKTDLSSVIASSPKGEFYKITVVLNEENVSVNESSSKVSVIDKIYKKGYNKSLEQMLPPAPDMGGVIEMTGGIKTNFNVVYFVDAKTFEPVAAKYYLSMNVSNQFNAYIGEDDQVSQTPTGYVKLNINNAMTDYYFFNDNFDCSSVK